MQAKTLFCTAAAVCLFVTVGFAQDQAAPAAEPPAAAADAKMADLHKRFADYMSGVKLVGNFTMLGREDQSLKKESYTISKVEKLPQGDFWMFQARIVYGGKDVTVPLPIEVKWAGDTPMITLTNFTIPGMGTFSSRVVIYNQKYAGTWTHGKVGGHMFGTIEKIKDEAGDKAN